MSEENKAEQKNDSTINQNAQHKHDHRQGKRHDRNHNRNFDKRSEQMSEDRPVSQGPQVEGREETANPRNEQRPEQNQGQSAQKPEQKSEQNAEQRHNNRHQGRGQNRQHDRNRKHDYGLQNATKPSTETGNPTDEEMTTVVADEKLEATETANPENVSVSENNVGSVNDDNDDSDKANAEEIKEFMASAGNKAKSGSKSKINYSESDHSQMENLEQYLDMDIRTGSNAEADAIAANIFLSRGLTEKPDVETAHCQEYRYNCCKLSTYDWIEKMNISLDYLDFNIAEVRFKNSHKDFYILPEEGVFHVGDIVAVEANPGHDIGIISMLGISVRKQLAHKRLKPEDVTKKLYRLARVSDIDKWISTVDLEHATMLSSRYIAWDLDLKMKVNDVEYQGDGTKAIFYYSAEERVDFRELIKILAEQFRIRIEMRQIGVRQEAARLGGIGSCGRELCCSSWLTNFQSVSTNTARTQQLSLNPQKLAGMCGKLKCCLNFEQSTYLEESKGFPAPNVHLKTKKGKGFYNKIDIFKKIVWYSYADDNSKIFAIPLDKVNEIIKMNNEGKFPDTLEEFAVVNQTKVEEGVSYSMDELKRIEDK